MAIPRERDNDPVEMPPPTICFSKASFVDCYHYKIMLLRSELPVEQPEGGSSQAVSMPDKSNDAMGNTERRWHDINPTGGDNELKSDQERF
ncbi:MAG TPA: hypothetical protein VH186_14600 [Chloroflexia bacterium]|nr:hypothetical protein [Chloroflexia bacterium]